MFACTLLSVLITGYPDSNGIVFVTDAGCSRLPELLCGDGGVWVPSPHTDWAEGGMGQHYRHCAG